MQNSDAEKISVSRRGPVAHVVLNRPGKLNALDYDCLDLLERHFAEIDQDDDIRAVMLSGSGRCFCAGADLGLVSGIAGEPAAFDAFLRRWHEVFGAIEACGKPTIAAVHGFALAGGFELVQVCDLLILAESATIGDQHARFGLFPGGGSTQRLPRMVPKRVANWLLFSGEGIDAATALSVGLANRVVPDDEVLDAAQEMALLLAERSRLASRAIKTSIRTGAGLPLNEALDIERAIAVQHMASADARHGLSAFTTRATPDFGYRREEQALAEPGAHR